MQYMINKLLYHYILKRYREPYESHGHVVNHTNVTNTKTNHPLSMRNIEKPPTTQDVTLHVHESRKFSTMHAPARHDFHTHLLATTSTRTC